MQFRKAATEELDQLIILQNENLVSNLSAEEKADGFLSGAFTKEQFSTFNEQLGIIVCVEDGLVLAFLVTSTAEANLEYSLPEKMISRYSNVKFNGKPLSDFLSLVAGPVCVAKSCRGRGIFEGLYKAMPNIVPSEIELAVALVSVSNPRSMRAHEKVGMEKVDQFIYEGREFYTLAKEIR